MSLPRNLAALSSVVTLNLDQNPFRSAADVLAGLTSMPALRDLTITLATPAQEEDVIAALPRLERLNGRVLDEPSARAAPPPPRAPKDHKAGAARSAPSLPEPVRPTREIVMTEDDLESVAVLYGAVKGLGGRKDPEEDLRLTARFDGHVKEVMRDLATELEGLDDTFLRQSAILSAKYRLYGVCAEAAANRTDKHERELSTVLRKLRAVDDELVDAFPSILRDMHVHYTEKIATLEDNLARAERQTEQLLEAAEELEGEAQSSVDENQRLTVAFEKERQRLLQNSSELRSENAALQKRIAELEAGGAGRAAGSSPGTARGGGRGKPTPASARDGAGAPSKDSRGARSAAAGGAGGDSDAHAGAGGAAPAAGLTVRNLTLKQLKETIEAIYQSKLKFDQKCADAHLPRETMEQHMYTYLNQRYGLKSLIIEYASSIIRAVNKYQATDNDVAVFGRILRNEIDEEFRYVQRQLKHTVAELLRVYLKGKFPLKTDDAIADLLSKRTNGFVYEAEWSEIVKYMYNHEDSLALIVMVRELIAAESSKGESPGTRRTADADDDGEGGRGRVRYDAFLGVLLDFQLRGHEKFLSKFRDEFRAVDADENGVLNEPEFRRLVRRIDPGKTPSDVEALLNLVDPFNNQHITFSECVSVLSSELVKLMTPPADVA